MSQSSQPPKRLSKEERQRIAEKKAQENLICAWVVTLLVMVFMVPMWVSEYAIGGELVYGLVVLGLASYIVFVNGKDIMKSAWISARHFTPNMHVLTMLGTTSAILTGILSIFAIYDIFPEIGNFSGIAGMIMVFNLTGSFIEQKLKKKSTNAIKSLISLSPKNAILLKNGKEIEVPVSDLQVDDVVLVKTGEKIPSDGVIVEGNADIDEALVTGESIPLHKSVDDEVIGGAINVEGIIHVRITKVGKQTFLQQVIKLVEQAQGTKPNVQLLADKVVAVFVPIILVIALCAFASWLLFPETLRELIVSIAQRWGIESANLNTKPLTMALYSSIAVLVVACPCALGLATPSAIALGVGKAAQLGALIKNASIFEKLNYANYIVMDKTGTITEGTPSIEKIYVASEYTEEEVLRYAAIIEKGSTHPLATTVCAYFQEKYKQDIPNPDEYKTLHGHGLQGTYKNSEFYVVNKKYIDESSSTSDFAKQVQEMRDIIQDFENKGLTISIVVKDKVLIGIIGFMDKPRKDSALAIKLLHKMSLKTVMLTGDNKSAAQHIAEEVNIDEVIAEAKPDTKIQTIETLQKQNNNVIMVGDGINDAPALTQAHIGVAMGSGTDVAAEAGDMVLIKSNLPTLVSSLQLSKKTYAVIKQNLFWAFIYNLTLIPLAFFGFVHPLYAEIAMGLSSITVLSNSMRLSLFKQKF